VEAWSFHNNDVPENGPVIYGWEDAPTEFPSPVRDGRQILSSLTGLGTLPNREPSHEWLGYFQKPPASGVPERFVFRQVQTSQGRLACRKHFPDLFFSK
jgi:hypothetical protein